MLFTKNRVIWGTYVIIAIVISDNIIKGITPFIIVLKGFLDKPVATNKFKPKGGVAIPIAPLTTIIIPR